MNTEYPDMTQEHRYGFHVWGLLSALLLLIFVSTVILLLFVFTDNIIFIPSFIILCLVLGAAIYYLSDQQRRRALKRRQESETETQWVQSLTDNRVYQHCPVEKRLSLESNCQTLRTSWYDWVPWQQSPALVLHHIDETTKEVPEEGVS